jgi:hypothetical protein
MTTDKMTTDKQKEAKSKNYLIKKLLPSLAEYINIDNCNVDEFIFNGDHTIEDKEPAHCICGVAIINKYSIKHVPSDNIIYPIGSECINHFKTKNMEDYNKVERFKHLTNMQVRGGKYRFLLYSEVYEKILYHYYYYDKNKDNKVYIKEMKEYYKLKYIDNIERYFIASQS